MNCGWSGYAPARYFLMAIVLLGMLTATISAAEAQKFERPQRLGESRFTPESPARIELAASPDAFGDTQRPRASRGNEAAAPGSIPNAAPSRGASGGRDADRGRSDQGATPLPPGIHVLNMQRIPWEVAKSNLSRRRPVLSTVPTSRASIAAASFESVQAPGSIAELARALKNDPDLIYRYVYEQIAFTPDFGRRKGPVATILDGSGTAFDQAALMVALLRQAGFSSARYVYGLVSMPEAQAKSWLGTDSINTADDVLAAGGFPGGIDGSTISFAHVWVKVNIGGTDYVFDPSIKLYTEIAGIDLRAAMQYDETDFLNMARSGATIVVADYVQHINRTNVRNKLSLYASSLAGYIRAQKPSASLDEIISGRKVVPLSGTPIRQTSLPITVIDSVEWTEMPSEIRSTLRIQYPGIDLTYAADEIYGKRLTLFSNSSNQGILSVDGSIVATGSVLTPGSVQNLVLTAGHPFSTPATTFTYSNSVKAGGQYFIANSWGFMGRGMVEHHRRILNENRFAGGSESSEPVLGQSLAIVGYTWLAELQRVGQLLDALNKTTTISHNNIGVVGYEQGPYIDIPGGQMSIASRVADPTFARRSTIGFTSPGYASALEFGAIEQVLPARGVSTISLIDKAVESGLIIFNATATNFSAIQPQLANASMCPLSAPSSGARIILPQNCGLTIDDWQGAGYTTISADQFTIGYIIRSNAGSHKGGDISFYVSFLTTVEWSSFTNLSFDIGSFNTSSISGVTSIDPIDLFTGNFLYSHDDLSVGSGGAPFELGFQRSYNSGQRLKNGPMGLGWSHNFEISTNLDSDGFQAMGEDSAIDATAAIATMVVTLDLLSDPARPIDRIVIAALAQRWFMDMLIDNVVIVDSATQSQQFIWVADGAYNPPPGSADTLVRASDGSVTHRAKDGSVMNFDTTGKIITWRNTNDVTLSFSYTGNKLSSVTNGTGRSLSFSYTGEKLTSVSDGNGRVVSYQYDSVGDLLRYTDALGNATLYAYDSARPGLLTQIFYPGKNPNPAAPTTPFVTNVYDSLGRVTTQTNAVGGTYQYYIAGFRAEETDPLGNAHILYFNARAKVLEDTDALGRTGSNIYDVHDRLVRAVLPEGDIREYTYDSKHNPLTITTKAKPGSPLADALQLFTYEPTYSKILTASDPLGRVTSYTYDVNNVTNSGTGNLLTTTKPMVNSQVPVEMFTYNNRGQIETATDPIGKVTRYTYDAGNGNLLSVTDDYGAAGHLNITNQFGYDAVGNVISKTDPLGRTTLFEYDAMRRTTRFAGRLSVETILGYDADGNVLHLYRSTGVPTVYQHITTNYTASGQKQSVTDPSGNVTTYVYDTADRLSKVTDAELRTTETQYDALGRIHRIIGANGQVQEEYGYTPNGKRLRLIDPRLNTTSYEYDGLDRLTKVTFPDTTYEAFAYDAVGNVLSRRMRGGQVHSFTYDPLNRQSTKSPQGLPVITYAYDLSGRVASVSDSIGTIQYNYDTAGRNTLVTYPNGKTVGYQYDVAGNRTRVIWPDNFYVTYSYDEVNRVKEVRQNGTTLLGRYDYDTLSRRTLLTYGNSATATYAHAANDNVTTITHQFRDPPRSSVSFTYGYNNVRQRNSQSASDDRFMYRPTANNDVAYGTANSVNQYPSVGAASLTYDGNGNLTGVGANTFAYDSENRLISAAIAAPSRSATYAYDALGGRKSKTVDGITTLYLRDGNHEIAEYDGASGALLRRYIYGPGTDNPLVTLTASGTRSYYHADAQGSIVALQEHASGFTQRFGYGPYGESTISAGTPYRYTARRLDEETGLYYYRARYYSPSLGRFLQTDPVGYEGGLNLYAYAQNDPLNRVDPKGTVSQPDNWGYLGLAGNASLYLLRQTAVAVAEVLTAPFVAAGIVAAILLTPTNAQVDATLTGQGKSQDPTFYHRLESPTQTPEDAIKQQQSFQIWGLTPRWGFTPTVQAYRGPLPESERGVEFTTPISPHPGSGVPIPGGEARWYGGITPGVTINDQGYAVIPAFITKNTQVPR